MKDGEWDFAHSQETLELHPMTLKGLNITADGKQRLTFFSSLALVCADLLLFLFCTVIKLPYLTLLGCSLSFSPLPQGEREG